MEGFKSDDFIEYAVNKYSGMITRIAFQYVRNKAEAEDIAQNVFVSLLKQPAFTKEEHLKAWLIRVTINKCKDYLRTARRRRNVALNREYAERAEFNEVFYELEKLPDDDRSVLYLYYYEGYPANQIAVLTGIKESAVFMRLARARNKLKRSHTKPRLQGRNRQAA